MREITDEDRRNMEVYRDEWIKIGLNTSECDIESAEQGIKEIYQGAGLPLPEFVWTRSPVEAVIYRHAFQAVESIAETGVVMPTLNNFAKLLGPLRMESTRDIRNTADKYVGGECNAYDSPIHNKLRDTLVDVITECGASHKSKLKIRPLAKERMFDAIGTQGSCGDMLSNCFWGQHEWWIAYYRFPEVHMGIEYKKEDSNILASWERVARDCGWWSAYEPVAICIDKPITQKMSAQNLGHCEDGPTMEYGDGFKVYMLEGISVDEQLVMRPETQTVAQIEGEENQDLRSIRIERFGWPRYLKESGASVLDCRHNVIENTQEALMESKLGDKRLVVTCPTGRMFALGVIPEVKTCKEAQAWLAGDEEGTKARVIART